MLQKHVRRNAVKMLVPSHCLIQYSGSRTVFPVSGGPSWEVNRGHVCHEKVPNLKRCPSGSTLGDSHSCVRVYLLYYIKCEYHRCPLSLLVVGSTVNLMTDQFNAYLHVQPHFIMMFLHRWCCLESEV